jgi:hypothetical protein
MMLNFKDVRKYYEKKPQPKIELRRLQRGEILLSSKNQFKQPPRHY